MENKCIWYSIKDNQCKILEETQCLEGKKCTFCECQHAYNERIKEFNKKMKPYIDGFNQVAYKNRWTIQKKETNYKDFMKMSSVRKTMYLKENGIII